jgi:pentatricopeptide repeat protein
MVRLHAPYRWAIATASTRGQLRCQLLPTQGDRAQQLLQRMAAAGVAADAVTFNARISLSGGLGDWEQALALLAEMKVLSQRCTCRES